MATVYEPYNREEEFPYVTYITKLEIALFTKKDRLLIVQSLLHLETLIERRLNYLFNTDAENNTAEHNRTQLKYERANLIHDIRSIQGEIEREKEVVRGATQFWV